MASATTVRSVGNTLNGAWRVYQFRTTGGPVTVDIVTLAGTTGTVTSPFFNANEVALLTNLAKALLANIAPADIGNSVGPILSRLVGAATMDATALTQAISVAGTTATLQVTVAASQYFAVYIPNEASAGLLFTGSGAAGGGGAAGPAGGDLSGTYPNPQVSALSGAIVAGNPTGAIAIRYGAFAIPGTPAIIVPETAPAGGVAVCVQINGGAATDAGSVGGIAAICGGGGTNADAANPAGNGAITGVGGTTVGGVLFPWTATGGKASATQAAGRGGNTIIYSGLGGEAVTGSGAAGAGGKIILDAGPGGQAPAPTANGEVGGAGGDIEISAGIGGIANATAVAGAGGSVKIEGGPAGLDTGGGGGNGGSITLTPGDGSLTGGGGQSGTSGVIIAEGRFATPARATAIDLTPAPAAAATITMGNGGPTDSTRRFTPFEASAGATVFGAGCDISAGSDGEELLLMNVDAANSVTFTNAATRVRVGNAGSRQVDPGGSLHLIYSTDLGKWVEIAYTQGTL